MGSTNQPLELACLKALEHARGFQSKQLVCVGWGGVGVCVVGRCWGVWGGEVLGCGGGGMHHEHSMPFYCTQVFAGFMCDQVKVLMRTILLYSNAETPNIPKVLHSSVSLPSVPTSLHALPTC